MIQQHQIRLQLSQVIQAVLSQTLLPRIGGGRIAAIEIMIATAAVRNLIREEKLHELHSIMELGSKNNMQTMDQALADLVKNKIIPSIAGRLPDKADKPVGGSFINGLKRLEQLAQVDPRASILRWSSYFTPNQKGLLWKKEHCDLLDLGNSETILSETFSSAPAKSFLDRTLFSDVMTYLPGDLLVKADRMTMAHSLEGRSPFLDHELAEWAARLPERYKLRGMQGKFILRKAFKDFLPEYIVKRRKQGFGIPVGTWLRGPLAGWTRDLLFSPQGKAAEWFNLGIIEQLIEEHQSKRVDHGKRLWPLLALELWANN